MPELNQLSVKTLAKLIRRRELTVSELLESFVREIERVNPIINALVQTDFSVARQAAFEADQKLKDTHFIPDELFGIPFTAKDLYAVPNHIVTFGTQGLMNTLCHQETTVISRLMRKGSIFLGLTNTPELGLSLEIDNLVYGRTNYPLKPDYSSGGSSGGRLCSLQVMLRRWG
ncbi:amidase family protein [Legionella sp. PATHC038]|uniref:amidase family protein n=1 Tax=Legionella sheltonii TaxID=2992041 RepID=UPI002242F57B|nr:amidase family protein [Legionella sp. PATHC038]MCW8397883.1 amidase family protein [Legionella sp. PATHC038]